MAQRTAHRPMRAYEEEMLKAVEALRRARMNEIVPFPYFKRFPKEIRLAIWEYSLPGPRIICPGTPSAGSWRDQELMGLGETEAQKKGPTFPKNHHTPNPAALSVCQESREVALTKYQLCFGTPNVYMNFAIDVFFFGAWHPFEMSGFWKRKLRRTADEIWVSESLLDPVVKMDLEKVQRIGICHGTIGATDEGWSQYSQVLGDDNYDEDSLNDGAGLRKALWNFKSLREVLLDEGDDGAGGKYGYLEDPVGQVVIEDWDVKLEEPDYDNFDSDDEKHYNAWDDLPRQQWESVRDSFQDERLTDEERKRGIPEIKAASYNRIPITPGWEYRHI